MKIARVLIAAVCLFAIAGCYVARIETGRTPSAKVITKPWVTSWIYGLVPPPVTKAAVDCPEGVAVVETQHSFLNYLAYFVTFGIYSPMQITITCAEAQKTGVGGPEPALQIAKDSTPEQERATFQLAADIAVKTHQPVYVLLDR